MPPVCLAAAALPPGPPTALPCPLRCLPPAARCLQGFNWESWKHGWFNKMTDQAQEIADMGFTAVWLPPFTGAALRGALLRSGSAAPALRQQGWVWSGLGAWLLPLEHQQH